MEVVWTTPFPSSWGISTRLVVEPKRVLRLEIADSTGEHQNSQLTFHDVQAYKCTYLPALTKEMISLAYDKLVATPASRLGIASSEYRCYVICFDDGPCYEVVAREIAA